ncbi:MAG TPA: 50S ribosomal protein L24 [Cellvibrionaceae bacterium]|nr:50S ribosomal protein L24 [Cellvibrionaceae bacterium]HNG58447.1 50S ribosomal protein L24 [Cellvibrionaceae bacterium]
MRKIKRDDDVIVLTGRDKGKRGKVNKVLSDGKLIVSGIQIVKKHQKPNPQAGVAGGIIEKEASIQASNVAIYNPSTKKADRVGFKILEDGKKIRIFKSTGAAVDA